MAGIKGYIVFIFLLSSFLISAQEEIVFQQISTKDGLSNNVVVSIAQDKFGFIWMATRNGLNRFDGQRFITFYHDPNDPESISSSRINRIFFDSSDRMWIGTSKGLDLFNPSTYKVEKHYEPFKYDPNLKHSMGVFEIYEDLYHNIWIGGYAHNNSVGILHPHSENIELIKHDSEKKNSINPYATGVIFQDSDSLYWSGTWCDKVGLDTFRVYNEAVHHIEFKGRYKRSGNLSPELVNSIFEDSHKNLWFASFLGLYKRDYKTKKFTFYLNEFQGITVQDVCEDNNGNIWIGHYTDGIYIYNPETKTFRNYAYNPLNNRSLIYDVVRCIFKDNAGNLWIGTEMGVSLYSPYNNQFGLIRYNDLGKLKFGMEFLLEKDQNTIYGSLSDKYGIAEYNMKTNSYRYFAKDIDLKIMTRINNGKIYATKYENSIFEFNGNNVRKIVKGIREPGMVLNYNTQNNLMQIMPYCNLVEKNLSTGKSKLYKLYQEDNDSLTVKGFNINKHVESNKWESQNGNALCFYTGIFINNRETWISTSPNRVNYYLTKFNFSDKTAKYVKKDSITEVLYIQKSLKKNKLWISTKNGLFLLNTDSENITDHYSTDNGLPTNIIYAVAETDNASFWVLHEKGISNYLKNKNTFENYFTEVDMPVKTIPEYSNYNFIYGKQSKNIYLGSYEGVLFFDPENVQRNTHTPNVYITDVKTLKDTILLDNTNESNKITLPYTDNYFTINFSALNYNNHHRNQYKYILEGLNNEWITTSENNAKYTHIEYGDYTFRLKGSNDKGIWNENEIILNIEIRPPWWLTVWAKVLWILTPLIILATAWIVKTNIMRARQQELQKVVDLRTKELKEQNEQLVIAKEQAEVANKMKSEFIANVSHDIRTPLNAIIGFSNILKSKPEIQQYQNYFKTIVQNGHNLGNLINDILELSKIEAGQIQLQLKNTNIRILLSDLKQIFENEANRKGIGLDFNISDDFPNSIIIDETRLRQILFNLIGNAIKFTHKGYVKVEVISETTGKNKITLILKVSDTGIGIQKEALKKIFEPFRQHKEKKKKSYVSAGLGLTIIQRLTKVFNGTINVESELDKGTIFTVTFKNIKTKVKHTEKQRIIQQGNNKKILIVDDIEENLELLTILLNESGFDVLRAEKGEDALKIASTHNPAMIILDIMMPDMNGYEVAAKLKENKDLQHIPIIAQTAFTNIEDEKNVFDGLINKPIEKEDLLKVVNRYLGMENNTEPNEIAATETEIHFEKLNDTIRNELSGLMVDVENSKKYFDMEEIKILAKNIQIIAEKHSSAPLSGYSIELQNAAINYDIEQIKELLNKFTA
jgi:signal transduction histidine kinase/DNA-binding response OmpR family regulator/streptogramin lyase